MKKYISDGTWFDKGTVVELIVDCENETGVFKGLHNGAWDEELCPFDEFIIEEA